MIEAVVDRIVDSKHIVLLVEEEEKEYLIPISSLSNHFKEGDWVTVTFDNNDEIIDIQQNETKTIERQKTIQDKMALLRSKKGSQFKSDK